MKYFIIILAFIAASCQPDQDKLIGRWKIERVEGGHPLPVEHPIVTFYEDETYTYESNVCTYTSTGTSIYFGRGTKRVSYAVSKNELIIYGEIPQEDNAKVFFSSITYLSKN